MTELPTPHSPLGASGAERWLECAGSISLAPAPEDVEDEDDDTFSGPGQAAHHLAEVCLNSGEDAWMHMGKEIPTDNAPIVVDIEMANGVQPYLNFVRETYPDRNQGNHWVERRFHCPSIHEFFYGTADDVYYWETERVLDVTDFKYGAGIVVEVPWNVQTMYYACGVLETLDLWDKVDKVRLRIVQPRAHHFDGPVRMWTVPVADLRKWMEEVLVPGMDRALVSRDTKSGMHCRFCPVRSRACPQLMKDMKELEDMTNEAREGSAAKELTEAQLGHFMGLFNLAKIINKAAQKTAFNRLQAGKKVPGFKLVNARSNRELKEGGEAAAIDKFGQLAYSAPMLLSPAQLEKLPGGTTFVERWAFKPNRGLTLTEGDDTRPAVNQDTKSLFTAKKGEK